MISLNATGNSVREGWQEFAGSRKLKPPAKALPDGKLSGRTAIPVVQRIAARISEAERRRLDALAEKLLRNNPSIARTDVFGPGVKAGLDDGSALLIGDHREIGLHETLREQIFEHRIALLADSGDILVVERDFPAHEAYLRELLDLRDFQVIALGLPDGRPAPVATRCRETGPVRKQLVEAARAAGRFQIVPHIGSGSAWALAGAVAREAEVPVLVGAPPPRLTRCVNDKIWFAARVREVLGESALPPTFAAYGPAAVAGRIARVARKAERIIVKIPDSAGSMGNVPLDADLVGALPLAEIRRLIISLLRGCGWRGRYPVLVGVWELDTIASPSIQVWIPERDQGEPVIEGIFEQRVSGPGGQFVGAVPVRIAPAIMERMADEAARLAWLVQALGYFGRCSFDCLVTTGHHGSADLHWIECNGRWGGVSVPMTLANRLLVSGTGGMVIVQAMELALTTDGVVSAHERLGGLLFRRGAVRGVVPLSAAGLARGTGLHFMAIAESQREADALSEAAYSRLAAG